MEKQIICTILEFAVIKMTTKSENCKLIHCKNHRKSENSNINMLKLNY